MFYCRILKNICSEKLDLGSQLVQNYFVVLTNLFRELINKSLLLIEEFFGFQNSYSSDESKPAENERTYAIELLLKILLEFQIKNINLQEKKDDKINVYRHFIKEVDECFYKELHMISASDSAFCFNKENNDMISKAFTSVVSYVFKKDLLACHFVAFSNLASTTDQLKEVELTPECIKATENEVLKYLKIFSEHNISKHYGHFIREKLHITKNLITILDNDFDKHKMTYIELEFAKASAYNFQSMLAVRNIFSSLRIQSDEDYNKIQEMRYNLDSCFEIPYSASTTFQHLLNLLSVQLLCKKGKGIHKRFGFCSFTQSSELSNCYYMNHQNRIIILEELIKYYRPTNYQSEINQI